MAQKLEEKVKSSAIGGLLLIGTLSFVNTEAVAVGSVASESKVGTEEPASSSNTSKTIKKVGVAAVRRGIGPAVGAAAGRVIDEAAAKFIGRFISGTANGLGIGLIFSSNEIGLDEFEKSGSSPKEPPSPEIKEKDVKFLPRANSKAPVKSAGEPGGYRSALPLINRPGGAGGSMPDPNSEYLPCDSFTAVGSTYTCTVNPNIVR